ncbi:hypothetical protein B0H13DRAFT_1914950 [Mycena leptocephala]|nr:hypothetical protein B0H13DRAFT_1914950 [Mycena leptocephala]
MSNSRIFNSRCLQSCSFSSTQKNNRAFKKSFPLTANSTEVSMRSDLTAHQLEVVKHKERNEKARLRMAKKRAQIKALAPDEQDIHDEKARAYKATYREKNRRRLAIKAENRRKSILKEKMGPEAYAQWRRYKRQQQLNADIKEGRRDPHPGNLEAADDSDLDS